MVPERNKNRSVDDAYLDQMRRRYSEGNAPWDSGVANSELLRVVDAGGLPGKKLLELGCGTGTNAIELARRGYHVTAIDLVDLAIQKARAKARAAGVQVTFHVGDLTRTELAGPYESVFDLGVYHLIRTRDLAGFLSTLARVTRKGSRWLSLAGNAREPNPQGPPVVTEQEFRAELAPLFRFREVREFRFNLGAGFEPLGWSILMERR
jgi:2-polyprenyl-3-methyl-5-hydroxy-6-metoxy-1,4-benzoquinol methylase